MNTYTLTCHSINADLIDTSTPNRSSVALSWVTARYTDGEHTHTIRTTAGKAPRIGDTITLTIQGEPK